MRSWVWALILTIGTAVPAWAGDAAPAHPLLGLDGFDAFDPTHREPGRLQAFAELGPLLARTLAIAWGRIEPKPPGATLARYDWKHLDEAVLVWQLSNLDPVLVLSPRNPWACGDPGKSDWVRRLAGALPPAEAAAARRSAGGATAPRADRWGNWERFVRAVVERYDGDGRGDMPGLRAPVRHIQVLDRAARPEAWLGSVDEYQRLLHHAGVGAKSAHPQTQVLAASVDLRGTGHEPYPSRQEWDFRVQRLAPAREAPLSALEVEREIALVRRLLESPRLFDVLPHVGSENHAEDVANLRFLRRALDEQNGDDVEVWLVGNPTRKLAPARIPGAVEPDAAERRLRGRWLRPATMAAHPEHPKALGWLRRGQALDLVRSLCRARAAGADALVFLAPWDRLAEADARRRRYGLQGLLAQAPDAPPTDAWTRTPSWYALEQANRLLEGQRSAGESRLGTPGRSVVFTLDKEGPRPWIAVLLLDGRLGWAGVPGEPLAGRDVAVALPNGRYRLVACRLGSAHPVPREIEVEHGMVTLRLTAAPLYVIPQR